MTRASGPNLAAFDSNGKNPVDLHAARMALVLLLTLTHFVGLEVKRLHKDLKFYLEVRLGMKSLEK